MNRYIIKATLCSVLLAAPVLSSCEFDQLPEGSIPTESSWQTVDDATNYNNGLLAALRGVSGGSYAVIPEVQADLFNPTNCNGNPDYPTISTWTFESASFSGDNMWSGNFGLITNANNIINNIDKVSVEAGSEEESTLKNYKAIAYFARAYAYSQMAIYYCKPYDTATAESTPGLPLLTTVDVNNKPARATLAETYAFIKADIEQAKSLFADQSNTEISEPTYNAALALEARVALQTKDYDTAIARANDLMAKYPLISDADEFLTMWSEDTGSEIIYEPQQTQDELVNEYSSFIYAIQSGSELLYEPSYIPSQGLMDLYTDADDYRPYAYFAQTGITATSVSDPNCYIFAKFPGNESLKKGSSVSEFYNMTKVFRVAEMYLIAAEAQYQKDGTGSSYLNTLRQARGASSLTDIQGQPLTGNALFSQIKDEWAREMCGEGLRFACLKRWGETMTRMTPQSLSNGVIYVQNNATGINVGPENKRWVWEIPQNDLTTNNSLVGNWTNE